MSQSRRPTSHSKRPQRKTGRRPVSRLTEWRESGDRLVEVFLCVGHLVAAVTLVVEHLI